MSLREQRELKEKAKTRKLSLRYHTWTPRKKDSESDSKVDTRRKSELHITVTPAPPPRDVITGVISKDIFVIYIPILVSQ